MKKKLVILIILFSIFIPVTKVSAQLAFCDLFPCDQVETGEGSLAERGTLGPYLSFGASMVFTLFIVFGIFIIIKAVVTIVRGEGSEESLEAGTKSMKSVFIGVVMLFLGIIGLLLITTLFGAQGIFTTNVENPEGVNLNI